MADAALNVGTLAGAITIEDLTANILMKVDEKIRAIEGTVQRAGDQMASAAAKGSFLGTTLADLAAKAISFTTHLIEGSVMAGARLEQLTIVSRYLGERAGYTATYVDKLSEAIEKSGITGVETRNAIVKLVNAHVDLKQASQLSATAQNMAIVSGRSSSDTYGMMIRAITTMNSQLIHSAGFTFTLEKVMRDWEQQTGKSSSALTTNAKQQILVNAMLKQGEEYAGLYGLAMGTAAKQISSSERVWAQVGESIGTAVLPLTNLVVEAWFKFGTQIRDWSRDINTMVGPTMSMLTTQLRGVMTTATEFASASIPKVITGVKMVVDYFVDLNDRFGITDHLLNGAKVAWGLLSGAFDIVGSAVKSLIAGWQSMPEWLQKITRGVAEGALVMGIYATAVNAAATPALDLINLLEKGVSIFANAVTGATSLGSAYELMTKFTFRLGDAYVYMRDETAAATVVTWLADGANKAMATSQAFLSAEMAAFSRRIGLTAVVLGAYEAVTASVAAVKTYFGTVLLATQLNLVAYTASLLGSSGGLAVYTLGTTIATGATVALGVALNAVKWVILPLIVLWQAYKQTLAFLDWSGLADHIEYASLKLQRWLGLIDEHATDADLWNSTFNQMKKPVDELEKALRQLAFEGSLGKAMKEQQTNLYNMGVAAGLSGKALDKFINEGLQQMQTKMVNGNLELEKLRGELVALGKEGPVSGIALKRLTDAAIALRNDGFKSDELEAFIKVLQRTNTAAREVELTEVDLKAQAMAKSFREAANQTEILEKAFFNLTNVELNSFMTAGQKATETIDIFVMHGEEAQKKWGVFNIVGRGTADTLIAMNAEQEKSFQSASAAVKGVDALINAHLKVHPALLATRENVRLMNEMLTQQDVRILNNKNLTLEQVGSYINLGYSLDDIARKYGVSKDGLQKWMDIGTKAAKVLGDDMIAALKKTLDANHNNYNDFVALKKAELEVHIKTELAKGTITQEQAEKMRAQFQTDMELEKRSRMEAIEGSKAAIIKQRDEIKNQLDLMNSDRSGFDAAEITATEKKYQLLQQAVDMYGSQAGKTALQLANNFQSVGTQAAAAGQAGAGAMAQIASAGGQAAAQVSAVAIAMAKLAETHKELQRMTGNTGQSYTHTVVDAELWAKLTEDQQKLLRDMLKRGGNSLADRNREAQIMVSQNEARDRARESGLAWRQSQSQPVVSPGSGAGGGGSTSVVMQPGAVQITGALLRDKAMADQFAGSVGDAIIDKMKSKGVKLSRNAGGMARR